MLFHVTDVESGRQIWESQSLLSDANINRNRERRHDMRIRVDALAQEVTNGWVPRTGAIFAWASFDGALQYSKQFQEPAIVQFNCSGPAWCVDNFVVEDVYREYSGDMSDDALEQLIARAEQWTNQQDSQLEVWFQPESVGEIYSVTDEYGDPLQTD